MIRLWKEHSETVLRVALVWLVVVGMGTILRTEMFLNNRRPFLEMAIHAGLWVFVLTRPTVAAFVRPIPRPHKLVILAFFSIFYAGQFTQNLRLTYPFTAWAMYARPQYYDNLTYYRYYGYKADGSQMELSPERIVPAGDKHVVITKLESLISAAFPETQAGSGEARRTDLTNFIQAIGAIYNRDHAEDPIESIEIVAYDWRFRDEDRRTLPPKPVIRIPLEAAR